MLQYFLNPAILLGLAGLSLPVIVHLISKRRYDVVEWGAMQFLELGKNARRKLRLEQLLLMLLRMGLIALIVFALSRPWVRGGLFTKLAERNTRDVVLVVDGSYSMGWKGDAVTPHQAAVRWAHKLVDELQGGDTVMLIDARDRVRTVIGSPSRDFDFIRQELDKLPPPSGSADLPAAVSKAIGLLNQGTNTAREIVVLTDGQALSWKAQDEVLWARVDDALGQAKFRPRIWAVDATQVDREPDAGPLERSLPNYAVDRLQLSRELTVPGFPVRIKTKVSHRGGQTAGDRVVHLEVDGQRLKDQERRVSLVAGGEASVEFEYRFAAPGSHLLSVVLDDDPLPGDNRADAAVTVADAVPVLLVDGDPSLEPTHSETFFLKAALTPSVAEAPLVRAQVVPWSEFDPAALGEVRVVVLADIPRLDAINLTALASFVERGGGLFIALGDKVRQDEYNRRLYADGTGLLPVFLEQIASNVDPVRGGVGVMNSSLELSWLAPHRQENGGEFHTARFQKWWKVQPAPAPPEDVAADTDTVEVSTAVVAARLSTGDPLFVDRRYGQGRVLVATSPVDLHSGWNTLAARRSTFVPLMHEMVFHLAADRRSRNVETGMPLSVEVPAATEADAFTFLGPDGVEHPPTPYEDEYGRHFLRLNETKLPGAYRFVRKTPGAGDRPEYFVTNFDRRESDLTPLNEQDRLALDKDSRVQFIGSRSELVDRLYDDAPRAELFRFLMLAFLAILVGEVFLTRRLVQGGHAEIDEPPPLPETQPDVVVAEDQSPDEDEDRRDWSPDDEFESSSRRST